MPKNRESEQGEALVAAISNGKLADAERLLQSRADIDVKVGGQTALHYVVASRSSIVGFKWLLEKGAALNELDEAGLTPLMTVCGRTGSRATEMAMALIEAGCDVKIRRLADGMSALEFAAKSADPSVLSLLVQKGASINGARDARMFPALLAVRAGNLSNLKVLAEMGADLSLKTQVAWAKGMTCLGVAKLERKSAIAKYLEEIGAP